MNPQTRNAVVLVVILVIGVPSAVWWGFIRKTPEQRAYLARHAESQKKLAEAGQAGSSAAAPEAAGAPQSKFEQADVDIDALLAEVKEVEFYYRPEDVPRDPMTPLVGAGRGFARGAEAPALMSQSYAEAIAKQMHLTGILWDEIKPLAVVNSEVVAEGHELREGIIVEEILKDRVILRVRDSLIPILLKEL